MIGYGHGFTYASRDKYPLNGDDNNYNRYLYPTFIFGMTNSGATLNNGKLYVVGFDNANNDMSAKFDNSTSIQSLKLNVSTIWSDGQFHSYDYEGNIGITAFDKPATYSKVKIHNPRNP